MRRGPLGLGWLLLIAALVAAAGAYPRYNRVLFGAPLLAAALACFAVAAWVRARVMLSVACAAIAAALVPIAARPSLAGVHPADSRLGSRAHVLLTLPADRRRAALFAELQPVDLPACRIARFGSPNDGGYLLCGNLLGNVRAGYSYGIGRDDNWGCDVARRLNVPAHQYDCFDPSRPSCAGGATIFHDECIGLDARTDEGGRLFDTLEHQLARNGDGAHYVVVKMDIEGAEWDSLLTAPPSVLERIDQLAIELHGVGQERHVATVRRLKQFFHVANVHFTNIACLPRLDPFPAWAYEVLFVNRRLASAAGPRPLAPHALDAPNDPAAPDCQSRASRWSLGGLTPWLAPTHR